MEDLKFNAFTDGYFDNEDLVPRYIKGLADHYFEKESREKKTIATREDHRRRIAQLKEYFINALGGIPSDGIPMESRITGKSKRKHREGHFTIERIVYTSLQDTWVTANLYLPGKSEGPVPGILFLCGHHPLGKACPAYQAACSELVMSGFAVLAIDPPGQGERYEYWEKELNRETVSPCTDDHSAAGFSAALVGHNILRYFLKDAQSGIDYLSRREEVDSSRIGVTGNSGGGTQTANLLVLDDRITAAAVSCYLTLRQSYMAANQAADPEQILWGAVSQGFNHDDYVFCFAPKPLLICSAEYDFFPIEGARGVYERAKRIYRIYGKEENINMAVSPSVHGLNSILVRDIQEWFSRHLLDQEKVRTGPVPQPLHPEELLCTGPGQVREAFGSKMIPDHTAEESKRLRKQRRKYPKNPEELRTVVSETLALKDPQRKPLEPQIRIIQSEEVQGISLEKLFYFTEEGIINTAHLLSPHGDTGGRKSIIFLTPEGTNEVESFLPSLVPLVSEGTVVLYLDPRGMGGNKTRKINPRDFWDYYGTIYKLSLDLSMMERSLLGDRIFDILIGTRILRRGLDTKPPVYTGFGYGAFLAYISAVMDHHSPGAVCVGAPLSFSDIAETRENYFDFRYYLFGLLKEWDLPELTRCFEGRKLRLIDPVDGTGTPSVTSAGAYPEYSAEGCSIIFSQGTANLELCWRHSLEEAFRG